MNTHPLKYMPYAQAHIEETLTGSKLISYTTTVCEIKDGWLSCFGLYSMTTRKHIGAYIREKAPRLSYYDAKWCFENEASVNIETRATKDIEKEDTTMKNTEIINAIENIELTEEEELFCAECGCVLNGERHEVDGEFYCDDCFEREFTVCEHCGEIIRKEYSHSYGGDDYCDDCFDELFAVCEHCGDLEYRDDMTYVESEDGYVCDHCLSNYYTECGRCGEWHRNGDMCTVYVSDDGDTEEWCEYCTEWHTWNCEDCGSCYSDDVDHDEDYICPDCAGRCCDTGNIDTWVSPRSRQGYHFKPMPCMCATSGEIVSAGIDWAKNLVFYGMELEIDRREKCCEENEWCAKIVDKLPTTYCKTDCSLDMGGSYSGIEIVSHPGTLAWYMDHKQDFVDCFDMLKEGGWLSHDAGTCGLHVHISLHPMEEQNPMAVHNMLIIYDKFWDKLVKFSRRTESQLDHWAKRYHATHLEYKELKHMAKSERNRYMAVNLQNTHTVEIRMFRGTLNPETFFATLQLVDLITKKCIELGSDYRALQALTWDELVSSDYAELNAYLERRGLKPGSVELPEPPESDEETGHVFHIGERVRVTSTPDGFYLLVGKVGIVRQVTDHGSVGVDFGIELTDGLHTLHNRLAGVSNNTGWFCQTDALTLVEDEPTEEELEAAVAEELEAAVADDDFIEGMRVEVRDDYIGYGASEVRGMTGYIRYVTNVGAGNEYAVQLDSDTGYGHNCDGHCDNRRGIWFRREHLNIVEDEHDDNFIPGMWVQLSADAQWDPYMPDTGVIVDVIDDMIGIELAGWRGGHDCNGHAHGAQGWYFNRELVTPVHAE